MQIDLLAVSLTGVSGCLSCRKRVIQMCCMSLGQTWWSCLLLALVREISLALCHIALHKVVLFFLSLREQGRLSDLSKADKCGFLPQSWKLNILFGPPTASLKNQFCVSNKAAHWSVVFHGQLGALRLSKSPSLQGYLVYLLPPCLDPENTCPSFPSHVVSSQKVQNTGAGRGAGSVIQGLWGCFVLYALNPSVRTNGAMEVAFVTVTEPGWIFLQSSASPLFKVSPTYERPGVCLDSCQNVDYEDWSFSWDISGIFLACF